MGIYRQKKSNTFWMSKTVDGILFRQSTGTASKMEARAVFEKWAAEIREKTKNGEPVITVKVKREHKANKAITFRELAERYLEFTKRLKSHDRLKSFVNTLTKRFNGKPINDFNLIDLENLQGDILNRGLTVAYANRLVVIAKIMFNKALDWELATEEAVRRVKKVKLLKGENKRLRYLTEEEAERLVECCEPSYLRPIVVTALNTGMRKSEIFNLTWDRVDFRNRVILLDMTKNGERSEIPINDTLYKTLSGLVRNVKTYYVFYNPDTLKKYDNLKRSWATALKKSHILDFRFHDLRHTFASRLVMAGVDLTTVKELLGHKDIKMTLRYSHLSQAHIRDAVSVLDKKIHTFFIPGENAKNGNS